MATRKRRSLIGNKSAEEGGAEGTDASEAGASGPPPEADPFGPAPTTSPAETQSSLQDSGFMQERPGSAPSVPEMDLPMRPGLGSVHLLQAELAAPMTTEQRLRGADGGVDRALLVTGYRQDAVAALAAAELDGRRLEAEGAAGATVALYRTDYTLVAADVGSGR